MRIVCPSCHAAYEVPGSLLAGGKAVRCARCGSEWTPAAPANPPPPAAEPPSAPSAPEPEPEAGGRVEPRLPGYHPRSIDTADDARPPARDDEIDLAPRRRGALIAWAVSLLLLALLIWAAFAFRSNVMGAWPPSERLFALLGLR